MLLESVIIKLNKQWQKRYSRAYLEAKSNILAGINFFKASALNHNTVPWFILLGKEQVGKASFLKFSEIHFPHVIKETDNNLSQKQQCIWWYSEKAVILEMPSRYLQEDFEEGLLWFNILRKQHKPYPAHGIILLFKLQDFADKLAAEDLAKKIRNHIEKIYKNLGIILPIHLFITHIDQLEGFKAFFNNEERYQSWGLALSQKDEQWSKFLSYLEQGYAQLVRWLFVKIQAENSLENKFELLKFPKQYRELIDHLASFLKFFIHDNPYQLTPKLNGIYFSGIQDNCSYFIRDSLENRIFISWSPIKQISLWHSRAFLQVILLTATLILSIFWLRAAVQTDTKFLHQVSQAGIALHSSLVQNVKAIEPLWLAYHYYQQIVNKRTRIFYYLDLSSYAEKKFIQKLNRLLLFAMEKEFLTPMTHYLEQRLNYYQLNWLNLIPVEREKIRSDYYLSLRAYLSLSLTKTPDLPATINWLARAWNNLFGRTLNYPCAQALVNFYFKQSHPLLQAKSQLIQLAREQLTNRDLTYALYLQLRDVGLNQLGYLSLAEWISPYKIWKENYQLPRFYTTQAWRDFVYPQIKSLANKGYQHNWVLALPSVIYQQPKLNKQQVSNVINALRSYYFSDYRKAWLIWLQNLQLPNFTSIADASKKIGNLKIPLQSVLIHIAEQWAVTEPVENTKPIHLVPELGNIALELRRLLAPSNELWQAYWASLEQLPNELNRILASAAPEVMASQYASQLLTSNSDTELYHAVLASDRLLTEISEQATQQALSNLLLSHYREAWRVVLQLAAGNIVRQWKDQIGIAYQQGLANCFPISEYGLDVTINELNYFLKPHDGALWLNTERLLSPFLQEGKPHWQERTWLNLGLGFNFYFLENLARAKRVSQALFRHSSGPGLDLSFYFIPTPGIREIRLNLSDTQSYRYRNGPQEWQTVSWSAKENDGIANLTVIEDQSGQQVMLEAKGPWALLHLLQKAKLKLDLDGVIRAVWIIKLSQKHNYTINLLLRSDMDVLADLLINHWMLPSDILLTSK